MFNYRPLCHQTPWHIDYTSLPSLKHSLVASECLHYLNTTSCSLVLRYRTNFHLNKTFMFPSKGTCPSRRWWHHGCQGDLEKWPPSESKSCTQNLFSEGKQKYTDLTFRQMHQTVVGRSKIVWDVFLKPVNIIIWKFFQWSFFSSFWFINQRALYDHALSVVRRRRPASVWASSPSVHTYPGTHLV